MNRATRINREFSIFDTIRQAGEDLTPENPMSRWMQALLNAGARAVGNRHLRFERAAIGEELEFEDAAIHTAAATARLRKALPRNKWLDYPGSKQAAIAMTWRLSLPMLLALAEHADEAEILIFVAFDATGSAQAAIKDTANLFYIGMSPEVQVTQFDLENEYPEESFYLFPKPRILMRPAEPGRIVIEVKGFDCIADMDEMRRVRWDRITDWAIDTDHDGVFTPTMQFFPSGWSKPVKKLAKAAERFEGLISPPFTPAERIAIQIADGRNSTHLLDLQVNGDPI